MRPHPAGRWVLALLPLALAWPALRHAVESRMSLHMLAEFPLLMAAGWQAQRLVLGPGGLACRLAALCHRLGLPRWRLPPARLLDWRGWTGASFASGVALVWMLPSALDAALLVPAVNAAKLASWWAAGWLLAGSWRRLDPELLMFVAGNLAWMMATAGLLYLDAPSALCVNYGADDQRHTGIGLVLLALMLGLLVLHRLMRQAAPHPAETGAARG